MISKKDIELEIKWVARTRDTDGSGSIEQAALIIGGR